MKLTASALACERNGRVVFSGLNFSGAAGELVELRGPNGSGKSTLLRLLAGLVPLSAGVVTLTPTHDESLPRLCHYIGHHDALKNSMTVRENLAFWSTMLGGRGADEGLHHFSLDGLSNDSVQLLSAGQRRRLALARLLTAPRFIWLLDEPMTALDAPSRKAVLDMIAMHLADGGIVIAATHDDWDLKPDHVITLGTVA